MGYFSNGTEGEGFCEVHCSRCLHGGWVREVPPPDARMEDLEEICPVWTLHLFYNSDQFPEHARTDEAKKRAEDIRTVLSTLIPGAGTVADPQRCALFVDAYEVQALPDPRQGILFGEAQR